MEISIKSIEYGNFTSTPSDFVWVTVSIAEETDSRPRINGEIKVPIKKQDITMANLESLAIEKVKTYLSSHK